MKTLKAPQKSVTWSAASIPALLLLGAACGSAVASTDIQTPCPESASQSDVLHAFLETDDSNTALVRTVEGKDSASQATHADTKANGKAKNTGDAIESPVSESASPEFTTSLPGVSANDMPRFRRHMFRTDI